MSLKNAVQAPHRLPALPYADSALEPCIDAQTLRLHHDEHHRSYIEKLNQALEPYPALQGRTALALLLDPEAVPQAIRAVVRNNAGGHLNHSMFWLAMSPDGPRAPRGPLADAIVRDFGDFERFKTRFAEAGETQFGSGWVWLTRSADSGRRLKICTTSGHDNPVRQGQVPVLLNDLWEHAYYLKHQNRRGDYLQDWWTVTNWAEAERRFEQSADAADGPHIGARR